MSVGTATVEIGDLLRKGLICWGQARLMATDDPKLCHHIDFGLRAMRFAADDLDDLRVTESPPHLREVWAETTGSLPAGAVLDRYGEVVRTWREAWMEIAAASTRLPLRTTPPASDTEAWTSLEALKAVHVRLASRRLAPEGVELLTGMRDHLAAQLTCPDHEAWYERLCCWLAVWEYVRVTDNDGPCDTWETLVFHPDYQGVCARTASVELAISTFAVLTGLAEFFSAEAQRARLLGRQLG